MVSGESEGSILESFGGLSAGSSPISGTETGRGPVVGWEPVQRTSILVEIGDGAGNFSSGDLIFMSQLLDFLKLAERA